MKITNANIKLLISTACVAAALAAASLHAQTPPVTAGLQLWLNADVGLTTNTSGQISAWADQSGLNNNASQATSASQPVVALDSLNGHATVRVTGSQFMDVPNAGGIDTLTNDVTILVVGKYDNLTTYRPFITKCSGSLPAPFDSFNATSVNSGRTRFFLSDKNNASPAGYRMLDANFAPKTGSYNILSFRWKDGVVDQWCNDFNTYNAVFPTMLTTNANVPLKIGRRADGVTQLVGNIAEILIYKPALSDADLFNTITNYLQPRYALAFDVPPAVSITAPTNNASAPALSAIPVSVSVSDSDGYVASVSVYGNGTLLGTATAPTTNSSAVYNLNVSAAYPGMLTLYAVATDNYGRTTTSASNVVNITGTVPTLNTNGLSVWLAADAGAITNATGNVTNWFDQSTNVNDAVQTDGVSGPLLVTNVLNGKPVLRFSGASQFLEVSDAGTMFLTNDFTTLAVARFNSFPSAPKNMLWTKTTATGVAAPVDYWVQSTAAAQVYWGTNSGGASFGPVPSGAIPAAQFRAIGLKSSGTTLTHYLDTANNGSGDLIPVGIGSGGLPMRIGRRPDNATQMNGDLAELLMYNQALSDTDRTNALIYLFNKYNLIQPSYVATPSTVAITSPTDGATLTSPSTIMFAATATASNGVIIQVTFSANGTLFATITTPPYQVGLDLLTPGVVALTAVARDNWNNQTTATIYVTNSGFASGASLPTNGLKLQLAADLGVTVDGTNGVSNWVDQSGNANDAAPTINGLPVLIAGALNEKPVIRFTNNTTAANQPKQSLDVPGAGLGFTAGDSSCFVLAKFVSVNSFRCVLSKTLNNAVAAPVDWYLGNNANAFSTVVRGNGAASTIITATKATPLGTFAALGWSSAGTTLQHFLSYDLSGAGVVTAPVVDQGTPMRIGRRWDNTTFGNYDVAEIVMYDHAVSDAERKQILDYLCAKWAICVITLSNKAPTVILTAPTNGTTVAVGEPISLVAQASDPENSLTRVNFLVNGVQVASRTTPPYQALIQAVAPGTLSIQAQAVDFWGATSNSAVANVTVTGSGPASPPSGAGAGMALWLKADAGVTTNIDGTVAGWADQSGNGNNAGPGAFTTPLLTVDAGGRPVVYFDGTGCYLDIASSPSLSITNDVSLFYAANFDDFTTSRSLCSKANGVLPHPFDYYVSGAFATIARGETRGNSSVSSSGALPAATNVVAGVTVQGPVVAHYVQGRANGGGLFSYLAEDAGNPLHIGLRDAGDYSMKGSIGELLIYTNALTGGDLLQINAYLASKFAVTFTQPYTNAPTLNISSTNPASLQLSWLPGYVNFILEGRTNLTVGSWVPVVTNPPNNQITIGTTNSARFFRLKSW